MARRAGIMTRYVEYRYPFVFLPVSFWVSPKKEGGRKTIAVTAHAASRLHAPEGRRRVLTSTIQTRSTVNPGTPHRRAALLANTSVPIVSRKEVADSRLSPGTNAGTKARIRYLFSSDDRNGLFTMKCSHAVRGSRVYD